MGKEKGACEGGWSERWEETQDALRTKPRKRISQEEQIDGSKCSALWRSSATWLKKIYRDWVAVVMGELCLDLSGKWRLGEGWRWGRADSRYRLFCQRLGMGKEERHSNSFGWIQGAEGHLVCVACTVLI